MVRIGRSVNVTTIHSEQFYAAAQVGRKDAAIILSYSGEDEFLIEIADYLLRQNIDIVSITNLGTNSIAKKVNTDFFVQQEKN